MEGEIEQGSGGWEEEGRSPGEGNLLLSVLLSEAGERGEQSRGREMRSCAERGEQAGEWRSSAERGEQGGE